MGKLATPDWIREGYDSKADWLRAQEREPSSSKRGQTRQKAQGKKSDKTYKVKVCPKCGSIKIQVIVGGEEGKGVKGWECKSCSWEGKSIKEKEMSEDEFLEHIETIEEEENKNG